MPYEIGFGKSADKKLVCVRLTDVKISDLAFLSIVRVLNTRREFVGFIGEIQGRVAEKRSLVEEGEYGELLISLGSLLKKASEGSNPVFHPLDVYMNPE